MNWSDYLLGFAQHAAKKSKDPTQVGAVLVRDRTVLAAGYNGPPKGVRDTPDRFERPRKYLFAAHAEMNLIATAAREGIRIECGAVYRDVPPHALAFTPKPDFWPLRDAQRWNCYGTQFSTIEYTFLQGLALHTRESVGSYLFTAIPLNDGYTDEPAQAKEFVFCRLDNGRLAILPTNMVLFRDASFGKAAWPSDLKPSTFKWSVE